MVICFPKNRLKIYKLSSLIIHLYIGAHIAFFVHKDKVRSLSFHHHGMFRICVFDEEAEIVLLHYIWIAILLYSLWLVTVNQIRRKMKTIGDDQQRIHSDLQRIVFFIMIKAVTFNVLVPLYIFDVRNAWMIFLCQSFVSNTCIYYVILPDSKAGRLWKCVHKPSHCILDTAKTFF